MSYIISEKAVEDIKNIWTYTAENWGITQADRYYNLIFDEIEYIVENYGAARDFSRYRKGYRYSKVKSHLVFFKETKNKEIEIIRVLHEHIEIEIRLGQ